MSSSAPHVSAANIRALYRRFTRFAMAIDRLNFSPYTHRYQITQNYPPVLHDIINLNTETIYSQAYLRRNGANETHAAGNPYFANFFSGWAGSRRRFHLVLTQTVSVYFRTPLHDPKHAIYEESMRNHASINRAYQMAFEQEQQQFMMKVKPSDGVVDTGPKLPQLSSDTLQPTPIPIQQSTPAQPISSDEMYALGVRTLYFLERAMGLRPHVCYVEYGSRLRPTSTSLLTTTQTATKTNSHPTATTAAAPLSSSASSSKAATASSLGPNGNSNHLVDQRGAQNLVRNHALPKHLPSFLLSPPPNSSLLPSTSPSRLPFLKALKPSHFGSYPNDAGVGIKVPASPTKAVFTQPLSGVDLSKNLIKRSPSSFPNTIRYTNIMNNRSREIKRVVPLSADPKCLQQLPPDKQAILYTIHQYFSQIELQLSRGIATDAAGGAAVKLTGKQKQAILAQLDPEVQDFLTNSFVINRNHRLEERLLHCISKAGYFSVTFQNTLPSVLQRYQLVRLLRELQLLIL